MNFLKKHSNQELAQAKTEVGTKGFQVVSENVYMKYIHRNA